MARFGVFVAVGVAEVVGERRVVTLDVIEPVAEVVGVIESVDVMVSVGEAVVVILILGVVVKVFEGVGVTVSVELADALELGECCKPYAAYLS